MDKPIDHIDEYLEGSLTPEDLKAFQKAMREDDFAQEVDLHKAVIRSIQLIGDQDCLQIIRSVEDELDRDGFFAEGEDQNIISVIHEIGDQDIEHIISEVAHELQNESFYKEEKQKPKARIISMTNGRRWMAIAASLIVLVVAGIMIWSGKSTGPDLYAQFYEIPEDIISGEIAVEQGELGFAGDREKLEILALAIKQYQEGQYASFLENSEALLNESSLAHYRDRLLFYRGVGLMEMEQYQEALEDFSRSSLEESDWYKLLAYLALEDIERAKRVAAEIDNPTREQQKLLLQVSKW